MMGTDNSDRGTSGTTREFDTDQADPNVAVVSAIADLEDEPVEDLPPLYDCIDHILEHLYSNPPTEQANVEISFTYYGYRITVEQHGGARFEPIDDGRAT